MQKQVFTLGGIDYHVEIHPNSVHPKSQGGLRGSHYINIKNPDENSWLKGWSYGSNFKFGEKNSPSKDSVQATIVDYVKKHLI